MEKLFHKKHVKRDTLSWMEGEGTDTLYAWGYSQETHMDKILPQIYFLKIGRASCRERVSVKV